MYKSQWKYIFPTDFSRYVNMQYKDIVTYAVWVASWSSDFVKVAKRKSLILGESFYLCLFSLLLPNEPNQTTLVRWRQDGTFCYYELIFHLPITSYLPSDTHVTVLKQPFKDLSYRKTPVPSLVITFIPWMRDSNLGF